MREVHLALRGLGCTYGYRHPQTTTFNDRGRIALDSPLRTAYAHIEPTIFGNLAASLRLLRIPQVVYALRIPQVVYALGTTHGQRSLVQHLLGVYGVNLAAIYGDSQSLAAMGEAMDRVHARTFPAGPQPEWLVKALGERKEFSPGDLALRTAVAAILASGVARAHLASGVLVDGHDGRQYCSDLSKTVGVVADADLNVSSLFDLNTMAEQPSGVVLMNREQLAAAGVPALLTAVLNTKIAPNVPIAMFAPIIMAFMWPDDREALGLYWSAGDEAMFAAWLELYSSKAEAHNLRPAASVPDLSDSELSRLHFFAAAERRTN